MPGTSCRDNKGYACGCKQGRVQVCLSRGLSQGALTNLSELHKLGEITLTSRQVMIIKIVCSVFIYHLVLAERIDH